MALFAQGGSPPVVTHWHGEIKPAMIKVAHSGARWPEWPASASESLWPTVDLSLIHI